MNTGTTNLQEEVFSELRHWFKQQIDEAKGIAKNHKHNDQFDEISLKINQLESDWTTHGLSVKSIYEHVKLLEGVSTKLFIIKINPLTGGIITPWCNLEHVSSSSRHKLSQLIRQALLLLVQQPDGVSYFGNLFSDWHQWSDGEPSNATIWRVWATYFREHANDPATYLLRASVRYLMNERPIDPYEACPGLEEHQYNEHIKQKKYQPQYDVRNFTDESIAELKAEYDATRRIRAKYPEKQRKPYSHPSQKKIERDIAKAIQLSGNHPEIRTTGLILRPEPLIQELSQLHIEQKYSLLHKKASIYLQELKNYRDVPGIKDLSSRQSDLVGRCRCYQLLAAVALNHDNLAKLISEYFGMTDHTISRDRSPSIQCTNTLEEGHFLTVSIQQIAELISPAIFAELLFEFLVQEWRGSFIRYEVYGLILYLQEFWKSYEAAHDSHALDSIDTEPIAEVLSAYPGYQGTLAKTIAHDGKDLFEAKLKIALLEHIPCKTPSIYHIPKAINRLYCRLVEQRMEHHAEEKYRARLDERNRVISELSHHIKNLSASVSEPLENLRHRQGIPGNVLEQALRGTGLIRNIVNAMNLSISGSTADFIFDATHLDQKPVTLDSIIWSALISAIPNMFDAKHFSMFQRNYFPTREAFQSAREAWNAASATEDRELILECLKNHFFDLSIEATGQSKLVLGDLKGSATKLLILCQEIMMNAVKYASTMDRELRTVRIHTSQEANQVVIWVENSCKTASKLKTSGVGHTIINNFAGLLGCEPEIQKAENSYSLKLAFANFSHMSNQGEHPDDTVC